MSSVWHLIICISVLNFNKELHNLGHSCNCDYFLPLFKNKSAVSQSSTIYCTIYCIVNLIHPHMGGREQPIVMRGLRHCFMMCTDAQIHSYMGRIRVETINGISAIVSGTGCFTDSWLLTPGLKPVLMNHWSTLVAGGEFWGTNYG